MSNLALCKAKDCKARIENGGSHNLCPRHSACNVEDKYNPDAYFCPHCLPWLLALRSTSQAEKNKIEKVSAAIKLRSWANQFRRLRLVKKLPGEWVEEASLKKLIYSYSVNSSPNKRTVTFGRLDDRNSSEDELKLDKPTYGSQKSALPTQSSSVPKRATESKSSTSQKGKAPLRNKIKQKGKLVKGINGLQKRKSLQKDDFSRKRKKPESVCSTANEENPCRICHEESKSPSPSVSSDCLSSPTSNLSFFNPDNPVNQVWDFSLQFDSLKSEIKDVRKGIDDLVSSQKCLGDSLKEKIDTAFMGFEDMFTKKFELLTKTTNSVHESQVLKIATQEDSMLSPENVNQQAGTSTNNTVNDTSSNMSQEASASLEQNFFDDGETAHTNSLKDNYLVVNAPEGTLSFLSKLFHTSEIWETFLRTKKVEWLKEPPNLEVRFEDGVLKDIQTTLCAPALPKDVGTRQLKAGLPDLAADLIKRDKEARQRLYDILVAIAVQEQLVQQLAEITRAEFEDSVPAGFLGNLEAHKLAIYSLICPLREAITEFFAIRLALRHKLFTSVEDNVRIKDLKGSSPFCPELFPESLVSSIHHSLRIAGLPPFAVFKEKQKSQAKSRRSLRKRMLKQST